jgi:hypothetical protein
MIVLLGPQRLRPTLPQVLVEHGIVGPIATVTAGWQEREDDDADLGAALGGTTRNLRLYARAEEVFREDREFHQAIRKRGELLRSMQDFYRIRLDCALEAVGALSRRGAPDEEVELAIAAVRALDEEHLGRCRAVHAEFDAAESPATRDGVGRHREEVAAIIARSMALAIAGGHVAVLLNRLRLFDVRADNVFAWSAGAMALTDRLVLFHDSPPQGPGSPEVLENGLGLCPGVVALPSPRLRLRLDDRPRVALYARRFAPATCLALDDGTWAAFPGGSSGVVRLSPDGGLS